MYHLFPRVWGKRAFLARVKAFARLAVQCILAATTHTLIHPCLPSTVGLRGGFPQIMTKILQIMTQFYHNPENFICSPRATELWTQTILLLYADPAVL